ncbi:hypothetical protein F4780DRAFT_222784 [Xylariomycetidae sp. FL0641]|nr:hypothetical protein F4780DRAFT_222784 [Xylariomycetidae sp. FL0641]
MAWRRCPVALYWSLTRYGAGVTSLPLAWVRLAGWSEYNFVAPQLTRNLTPRVFSLFGPSPCHAPVHNHFTLFPPAPTFISPGLPASTASTEFSPFLTTPPLARDRCLSVVLLLYGTHTTHHHQSLPHSVSHLPVLPRQQPTATVAVTIHLAQLFRQAPTSLPLACLRLTVAQPVFVWVFIPSLTTSATNTPHPHCVCWHRNFHSLRTLGQRTPSLHHNI